MPAAVLDTSVVVRFLTNDDTVKAAAVRAYLATAAEASLLFPDVAVAEMAFVLLRVYRWPRGSVADALRAVSNHQAIVVPGRELWLDVADDLERGQGLIDAYLLRTAERGSIATILTYDADLRPMHGVRCAQP